MQAMKEYSYAFSVQVHEENIFLGTFKNSVDNLDNDFLKNSNLPQHPTTDLNKKSLLRPKTTTA